MQDVKMTDQLARHENARHKIVKYFSSIVIIVIISIVLHYPQNTLEIQNKDYISDNYMA